MACQDLQRSKNKVYFVIWMRKVVAIAVQEATEKMLNNSDNLLNKLDRKLMLGRETIDCHSFFSVIPA